jgi:hypothetical protein
MINCPICRETDPMPAWICLARVCGAAEQGKPCSYSVEGHARSIARMKEQMAEINTRAVKRSAR